MTRTARGRLWRLFDDERVRFLLVGGINTAVGYVLFVAFELLIGRFIGYLGSLYASYAIATVLAFILHRRFTFRASNTGNAFVDFLRFQSVYVVSLVINSVLLPLFIEWLSLNALVAQAIIVVLTTLLSYFGHKWFSFRRPSVVDEAKHPL